MDDRNQRGSGGGSGSSGAPKPPPPSSSNGSSNLNKKKRKNKRRRGQQRKNGGASSTSTSTSSSSLQQQRGPPLAPTMKVTLRNIRETNVAQTIRTIILHANETTTAVSNSVKESSVRLRLDEVTLEQLETAAALAVTTRNQWPTTETSDGGTAAAAAVADSDPVEETGVTSTDTATNQSGRPVVEAPRAVEEMGTYTTSLTETIITNTNTTTTTNGMSNPTTTATVTNDDPTVQVRVLYWIPPRKTRRRGDKPGICYLLLTAPPISPLKPLSTTTTGITADLHPITEEDHTNLDGAVEEEDHPPATTTTTNTTSMVKGSQLAATDVDYSRDMAQRRLLLDHALERLQQVVAHGSSSSSSSNDYNRTDDTTMVVEPSMNDKVWKTPVLHSSSSPLDRLAGSIYQTEDYQQFILTNQRTEEERKARPKPPPGGGVMGPLSSTVLSTSAAVGGSTTTLATGNGAPVAALVLHLQKKQQEENVRKLVKRREQDTKQANLKRSAVVKPKALLTTSPVSPNHHSHPHRTNANSSTTSKTRRRTRKPSDTKKKPSDTTKSSSNSNNINSNNNHINRGGG